MTHKRLGKNKTACGVDGLKVKDNVQWKFVTCPWCLKKREIKNVK